MTAQPDPAALRALVEKATKGEWRLYDGAVCSPDCGDEGNVVCMEPERVMTASLAKWDDNAAFIIAAKNVLPALLDERAADKARIAELEADIAVAGILAMSPEEAMEGVTEQDIADMRNGVTVAVRLVNAEKRIAELEQEGAYLSAGQCISPGQHGLVGDEHGNSVCTAYAALLKEEALSSEKWALAEERQAWIVNLARAVKNLLPIGDATKPDSAVFPIYVRMSELRALHELVALSLGGEGAE